MFLAKLYCHLLKVPYDGKIGIMNGKITVRSCNFNVKLEPDNTVALPALSDGGKQADSLST